MAIVERFKTDYPGVYFIVGKRLEKKKAAKAKQEPERIYYIRYRRNGKLVEEKAGRQYLNSMTAAKAANLRSERMTGKTPSNEEKRRAEAIKKLKKRWTIDALWTEYTTHKESKSSFRQDKNRYKLYLEKPFGNKEPSQLIQLDIDRLRLRLLKKKSPQTVKHVLALLRRLINFGYKKGLCPPPPFKIEMPTVDNETTEDLNTDQLKRLLKAIKKDTHPQAGNMMLMALYSGMRRGEMFKLKWTDVDFNKGFIALRDPKGGADQTIPLNDATRKLLSGIKRNSKFVFPGRGGNQRTDINKAVNEIKTAAKLPKDFRPLHGLRHVYASMLASSGKVDLYVLQRLLTHKSPDLTQRYAHLRDDALKDAANLAGSIINAASKTKITRLKSHSK